MTVRSKLTVVCPAGMVITELGVFENLIPSAEAWLELTSTSSATGNACPMLTLPALDRKPAFSASVAGIVRVMGVLCTSATQILAVVALKFVAEPVTVTFLGPVSDASATGVMSNTAVKAPAGMVTLVGTIMVDGEDDTRFTVRAEASGLGMLTLPAPA